MEESEGDSLERLADAAQRLAGHLEWEATMRQADIFAKTRERMEQERRERAERRADIATAAAVVSAAAGIISAVLNSVF